MNSVLLIVAGYLLQFPALTSSCVDCVQGLELTRRLTGVWIQDSIYKATQKMLVGQTISHYRILEKLGGGMRVVYQAKDLDLAASSRRSSLRTLLAGDRQILERFGPEAPAERGPMFCSSITLSRYCVRGRVKHVGLR